jgi:TRAP-type mannitol/chloroaromatic compound transport system permease small subunit
MVRTFIRIADALHGPTAFAALVSLVVLLGATSANLVLRYAYSTGYLALQDAAIFAFGIFAMLAVPCAFHADRHVRIDLLASGEKTRWRLDLKATVLLFLPIAAIAVWYALPSLIYSWKIGEGSPQFGGLPFYYLVRTAMPLAMALSVIQAISLALKQWRPRND